MDKNDLVLMIGNISRSLFPVQHLISGLAYLIGILFFITAIAKLKKIGDARARSSSQEKMFVPMAFFLGGAAMLYLPTAVNTLTNTTFGLGSGIGATPYDPYNIASAMGLMVQTAGLIWFIRGCVLLVTSSEPGVQQGPKGLAFLCAGVLAMNFDMTIATASGLIEKMAALTLSVKSAQGY